jgi:EAL domain-containing protein (putative c-di-GMP-specific phosphodiesterase class I)
MLRSGRHARVTTSIGITVFDGSDAAPLAEALLVEADVAMYDAKAAGKDTIRVFQADARRGNGVAVRENWLQRLREAVEEERFVLHAQPIVRVCGTGVPLFELLIRLPDEHGDLIPPGAFLYNAERFGLIQSIDHWVMGQAVRMIHQYHQQGCDLGLSINVSAKTMNEGAIADHLRGLLDLWPIPEGRLIVELTETAAIANIERAQKLAGDLRNLGCRLALDDFGAGFATFYYLKHLKFDYVKIDGEFIKQLPTNPTDQLVVRALVGIAKELGTVTVAEYVQDDETLALLQDFGVGYAQGYHTGRPGALEIVLPQLQIV